jgi:catechol-2,3-dioxygenase
MLKPVGLIRGHYECRSFEETLPILTAFLALEVVERKNGVAVVKHPNTDWLLIVHEGGPDVPNKPHNNHYGVRVASDSELQAAWEYLESQKVKYGIKRVSKPHEAHFAHSVYFGEPGGNDWEIEYYDPRALAEGRLHAAPHWGVPMAEERFPGRGYLPQALTHGTLQCDCKEPSDRFYQQVLGLQKIGGGRTSSYIKHPSSPWYIVVLPGRARKYLSPASRFTLELDSPEAVVDAHREFSRFGKKIGITELGDLEQHDGWISFIFSDLDRNWWEATAPTDKN